MAYIIWSILFIFWLVKNNEIRTDFCNILKTIMQTKILIFLFIIIIYNLIIIYIFAKTTIWECMYFKDIMLYIVFSTIPTFFSITNNYIDKIYIKDLIVQNITIICIINFFITTFTFNIFVELILCPISIFLSMIIVYSDNKQEYKDVNKFIKILNCILLINLIIYTFLYICGHILNINWFNILITFLIPIIYTILNIPILILLKLWTQYDDLYTIFKIYKLDKSKILLKTIKYCRFSQKKLDKCSKFFPIELYIDIPNEKIDILFVKLKENKL